MATLTRAEAAHVILKKTGSTLFSVTFTKKDGTEREMVARLHCHNKKKTDNPSTVHAYPQYITVYDFQKEAFRNLNVNTLTRLKTGGVEYDVK
jgi:Zn-dependent metalloprotease